MPKTCNKCKSELTEKDFYTTGANRTLRGDCKECFKKYIRANQKIRIISVYQRESKKYWRKKTQSKKRGRIFTLSHEEFMKVREIEHCHYCKKVPKVKTIDCINIQKGYVFGNVVMACQICNRMKSNFSAKDIPALKQIIRELEKTAKK